MLIRKPTGTEDLLPKDSYKWQELEEICLDVSSKFGFSEIRTPTFEDINLFKRGVGDTTDVVQKEMYQVKAEKSKDLYGLKPEGTAGVVRSLIETGTLNDALPISVSYITSCFRHERNQKGRLREFHQFGCETFGTSSPSADAMIINVAKNVFDKLGLTGVELNINSIGCKECRAVYHYKLKEYFSARTQNLCETCVERLESNPMRILDCKSSNCKDLSEHAPLILDYLCEECETHFEAVKSRLDTIEIEYKINPKIVRGLDYYTKTVFEFVSTDIGAQGTICGGGRYDGLVEQLGGKPTPALGFGMGLERILLQLEAQGLTIGKPERTALYIVSLGENASLKAFEIASKLSRKGYKVEYDLMQRSLKAQMKYANKINSAHTMVLGDSELETGKAMLKNMDDSETQEIIYETQLESLLNDAELRAEADEMREQLGGDAFMKVMGYKKI